MEIDTELPGGFIVHGSRPERWIRQTSLDNDEAVGYLADRLARLGVEEALAEAGAQPGAPVTIGEVTFDWEPSTPAGVAVLMSGRGTDRRLDQSARIPADERKAARIDRRRPQTRRRACRGGSWAPSPARAGDAAPAARGRPPDRGQGRVVVADQPGRRA